MFGTVHEGSIQTLPLPVCPVNNQFQQFALLTRVPPFEYPAGDAGLAAS
jgi:hypothetical protein